MPAFADLRVHVSRVLLANWRPRDESDDSPPDPFIVVIVSSGKSQQRVQTRVHNDTLSGHFDETFLFSNVSVDASVEMIVYDADKDFKDVMGYVNTTPGAVVQSGWNAQLHLYTFADLEGIVANVTYA